MLTHSEKEKYGNYDNWSSTLIDFNEISFNSSVSL